MHDVISLKMYTFKNLKFLALSDPVKRIKYNKRNPPVEIIHPSPPAPRLRTTDLERHSFINTPKTHIFIPMHK